MTTPRRTLSLSFALTIVNLGAAHGEPPPARDQVVRQSLTTQKPAPASAPVQSDLDRFQGHWRCLSVEFDAATLPARFSTTPGFFMAFPNVVRDQWTGPGHTGKTFERYYSLKLTPNTQPKQVDFVGIEERLIGIYKLERDALVLCLSVDRETATRPTEFLTHKGSSEMVFRYERRPPGSNPLDSEQGGTAQRENPIVPKTPPQTKLPDLSLAQSRNVKDLAQLNTLKQSYEKMRALNADLAHSNVVLAERYSHEKKETVPLGLVPATFESAIMHSLKRKAAREVYTANLAKAETTAELLSAAHACTLEVDRLSKSILNIDSAIAEIPEPNQ